MIKKFVSRKFITLIGMGLLDVAVATGYLPVEGKQLFIALANGLAGIYVTIQGIIDLFEKGKTK